MVVASIALLVALGGTSFAAVKLSIPANSVGTTQLKSKSVTNSKLAANSVTSDKVANRTLVAADFKPGQLPIGPPGERGPSGPSGPSGPAGPGSAARWVLVARDGSVLVQSSGLSVTVAHPSNGVYYVTFPSPVSGHAIVVQQAYRDGDASFRGSTIAAVCGGPNEGTTCSLSNTTSTVFVAVEAPGDATFENHAFYLFVP
jgi:hypothetical protein